MHNQYYYSSNNSEAIRIAANGHGLDQWSYYYSQIIQYILTLVIVMSAASCNTSLCWLYILYNIHKEQSLWEN